MAKRAFLNQKLGKNMSRKADLQKARWEAEQAKRRMRGPSREMRQGFRHR